MHESVSEQKPLLETLFHGIKCVQFPRNLFYRYSFFWFLNCSLITMITEIGIFWRLMDWKEAIALCIEFDHQFEGSQMAECL